MPSSGTRWKAAFVMIMAAVAVWMVWASVQLIERRQGEDDAQRELVQSAEQIKAACGVDPAEVRRLLGVDACVKATEITERPPAEKGEPGPAGAQGPAGVQGEPGPRGPAGIAGPQGPRGPQGPAGVDGSSPACLLTANACTGATGPQGPRGATGEQGAQGERGATGATGEKGDQGETGAKGDTGERGAKGDAGTDGRGIASVTCDSQTPITFQWTWTDGTVGTATCGGATPPPNNRR